MNLTKYQNWLSKRNLTPQTIRIYLNNLKQYGNQTISNLNVINYLKNNLTKLEPNTLKVRKCALAAYAKFQKLRIDWQIMTSLIPQVQSRFFATINQEELEQLKAVRFEESQQLYQRNNLILDFFFYTGLRVSELVNIKHRDWQNNSLRILGKGNKIRYVFLPEFLIEQIQPNSAGYLFTSHTGRQLLPNRINFIISQRAKLADLKKWISPHTFRRSFATLLDRKGARMSTIQKLLGHSKLSTTATYIHNDFNTLYEDYSRLWKEPNYALH